MKSLQQYITESKKTILFDRERSAQYDTIPGTSISIAFYDDGSHKERNLAYTIIEENYENMKKLGTLKSISLYGNFGIRVIFYFAEGINYEKYVPSAWSLAKTSTKDRVYIMKDIKIYSINHDYLTASTSDGNNGLVTDKDKINADLKMPFITLKNGFAYPTNNEISSIINPALEKVLDKLSPIEHRMKDSKVTFTNNSYYQKNFLNNHGSISYGVYLFTKGNYSDRLTVTYDPFRNPMKLNISFTELSKTKYFDVKISSIDLSKSIEIALEKLDISKIQ